MEQHGVLILFSGGADSALLLQWALKRGDIDQVATLTYTYGQKHEQEVGSAKKQLQDRCGHNGAGVQSIFMDITSAFVHTTSNLLGGRPVVSYPRVHEAHVPARNAIFLSIALGVAESQGYSEIWYGADFSDRLGLFPDCYQEWVVRMNHLAAINGSRSILIKAPLLGLNKDDVLALLKSEGVNLDELCSGYPGTDLDNNT